MIYEFYCKHCNLEKEVYRPAKDYKLPEHCDLCGLTMQRRYSVPQVSVFKDYYNEGLGIKVNRKDQVTDEIKRIRDETGKEVIEVGNEKVKAEKKASNYKLSHEEYKLVHDVLKGENQEWVKNAVNEGKS